MFKSRVHGNKQSSETIKSIVSIINIFIFTNISNLFEKKFDNYICTSNFFIRRTTFSCYYDLSLFLFLFLSMKYILYDHFAENTKFQKNICY